MQKRGALSIQEEIEQSLIEQCINVDVDHGVTTAKLPFIMDPWSRLEPNEQKDNPEDKLAVIGKIANFRVCRLCVKP